jgi:hypothetical protein
MHAGQRLLHGHVSLELRHSGQRDAEQNRSE